MPSADSLRTQLTHGAISDLNLAAAWQQFMRASSAGPVRLLRVQRAAGLRTRARAPYNAAHGPTRGRPRAGAAGRGADRAAGGRAGGDHGRGRGRLERAPPAPGRPRRRRRRCAGRACVPAGAADARGRAGEGAGVRCALCLPLCSSGHCSLHYLPDCGPCDARGHAARPPRR